jgi:hypothetical protein
MTGSSLGSVPERRARLARRHLLAASARAGTAAEVAAALIALHGTDPASVYLAAWARSADGHRAIGHAAVERALYDTGDLVRMLGMRRTMFVVPADLAPVIQASCTERIAERMRSGLIRDLAAAGVAPDAGRWLEEVEAATVKALTARGTATGAELSRDEPLLRTRLSYAEGKSYGGTANVTTRVLMLLSAERRIARGRPRGGWTSSQYEWAPADPWPAGSAADARAQLARRWLLAFGPAPVSDLQWWTGWTAGQTRAALARLDTAAVDLDGTPGVVLADDVEAEPGTAPWAALLPALDPTPMGWRDRGWFLGGHAAALFDRSGNIGPTVWWDGRIVGGWAQRPAGEVAFRLLEDLGVEAVAAVTAEAEQLQAWLGAVRVTPRFRTALERELSAR